MISFRNDILPLKNALYRLALRITQDSTEAQDIVQETLIRVWNQRDRWNELESMEAFSMTICRNLSLDFLKRKDRQHALLDDQSADYADQSPTPFDRLEHQDRMAMVRHAIDALPEKQRTCMQLRDIEGRSYKEIAAVMGISEDQVKVNIFRARQAVKVKIAAGRE